MICEMCGKDVPSTRTVFIEGTSLSVCPNCAKFGDENRNARGGAASGPSSAILQQRLERRERRMNPKNLYDDGRDRIQLIIGYGDAIKDAREAKGMDLEKFAASISEKKGTLAKIEAEDLTPDDKIIKKIEKALGIKLTEVVQGGGAIGGNKNNNAMTLANFIKKE
ncbi:MAG: multiprotein bridging factor aMBF1 [Candidatus Methanomethylophilaceae archaeon]